MKLPHGGATVGAMALGDTEGVAVMLFIRSASSSELCGRKEQEEYQ